MPETTVIQEFLAELGFKVDQKTLGDFTKALKTNATQAVAFGKTWSDVGEGVVKDAAKMVKGLFDVTSQLDQLYFASRRMQETASNISAMSYVWKQMGLAPERGQALGESLQEKQVLMGKQTFAVWANQVAPGAGVLATDTPDIAQKKMMHALSLMAHSKDPTQQRQALVRAQMLGISLQDLQQWDPSKDQAFWDESKRNQQEFGANLDENAKRANETATEIRQLQESFDNLTKGMVGAVLPAMKEGARESNMLAGGLSGVARAVEGVANSWANLTAGGVPQNMIPGAIGFGVGKGLLTGVGRGAPKPQPHPSTPPAAPAAPAAPPPAPGGAGGTTKGVHWDVAQHLYEMLVGMGANPEAARGAVGVLGSESMGFNVHARPWSKKLHRYLSTALGLGQWLKARRSAYEKATGQKVGEDEASQMALMRWELLNPGKAGLPPILQALMHATTAAQGADIWEQLFEGIHPGHLTNGRDDYAIDKAAYHRYLLAPGGGAPTVGTQNFTFNIRSTDPLAAGREAKRQFDAHTGRAQRRALS